MARRSQARLRNIGIVAHINAGKTTLTERFLFRSGKQRFFGAVDDGTATMDFMPEEQERGISISAAVTSVDWRGFHINLVDTPGHVDFTAEVERSLRVLDGVIVVLDGVRGVESQTEIVWRQVQQHGVPAIVFINKMDRASADFEESLIELADRLQCPAVPLVLPIRRGEELVGLCDLVGNTVIGQTDEAESDPEVWRPSRQAVIEASADYDDEILADFVDGVAVEPDRLHRAIRRGTLEGGLVPVLTGSALRNRGLDWLLSAVCRYLPSPVDRPAVGIDGVPISLEMTAPLCALVFKVQFEDGPMQPEAAPPAVVPGAATNRPASPSADCLYFVRVYGGEIRVGDVLGGSRREAPVTVGSIYRVHAAEHEAIEEVGAGDVVAITADADLSTGETLYSPGHPVSLEPSHFPSPVLTAQLEALQTADFAPMVAAAERLAREDPTLVLSRDAASGGLLVSGMGELHLQVFEQRLGHALGTGVRMSPPRVLLNETLARAATVRAECRRHFDGKELSATVELSAELAPGTGPATVGEVRVEDARIAARIRRTLQRQLDAGLDGPYPAFDLIVSVRAVEGQIKGRSGEAVYGEALAIAGRKLVAAGGAVTLEPYVDCVVSCPSDTLSGALADLRSRGVEIADVHTVEGRGEVRGELPLARVLGYATQLRSMTRGLGAVHLRPVGHRPVGGQT